MSMAVCLRCGEWKTEAFQPCPVCAFDPARAEDDRDAQARSLLLSEPHSTRAELHEASRALREGRPLALDGGRVAQLRDQLATQRLPVAVSAAPGPSAARWGVLAVLAAAVAVLAWLLLSRR